MMEPVKYKLTCYQGTTFSKQFIFGDNFGNSYNLTGWDGRMHVRESIDAEDTVLNLSAENGGIVIDADKGAVTIFVDAENTAGLTPGSYVYDLELITPSDHVYKPLYGAFKVIAEVTR